MQNIIIQNEATIKAKGTHKSKLCKPVICIETGEVYASATDAADRIGVHYSMMSAACTGKVKSCKGNHYCYLNAALENLDAVMHRLRQAAAMEEDAKKWRAQEAIKEEERKAKAKHDAAIERVRAKIAKHEENCKKLESKLLEEEYALMEARNELDGLLGSNAQQIA